MATQENPVGPQHMQTFSVLAPKSTHWRKATCEEVNCPHYLHGWRSTIDETSDLGKFQADYIRKTSGRRHREERDELGMSVFTFEAGQRCFASDSHETRIDRPELFLVRDGDKRGNPRGTKPHLHSRAEFWLEQFATNQDRIAAVRARG